MAVRSHLHRAASHQRVPVAAQTAQYYIQFPALTESLILDNVKYSVIHDG